MPFSEGHFHFWMQIHLVQQLSCRAQPGRPRQRPATVRGRSVPGSRVCAHTQAAHTGTRWRTRRWRRGAERRAATARPAARRRSGHRAPAARGCWAQRPRLGGGAGAGHQQPAAAQLLRAAPRRGGAAGQHRGGRRTAPGSAANATHLDRRGLSPSLAPAPRRGRAATASIAGRRPAHSSNVHRDRRAQWDVSQWDVSTPVPKIYFPRFLKGVTFPVETVIPEGIRYLRAFQRSG